MLRRILWRLPAMAGTRVSLLIAICVLVFFQATYLPLASHLGETNDDTRNAADVSSISFVTSSPSVTSAKVQLEAAKALVLRLIPELAPRFQLEFISEEECGGAACFEISDVFQGALFEGQAAQQMGHAKISVNEGNSPSIDTVEQVRIRASSGVDVAAGLHYYLKTRCGVHISWEKTGGSQLESIKSHGLKGELPKVGKSIRVTRPVKWTYYQNVCTVSYSMAWWDWARWEEEIGEHRAHSVSKSM
jgi:hypothetical protein